MVDRVNENSTAFLSVAFTDKDGNPEVPTAVNYQIDDYTNGVVNILPDTVFGGGLASTIEITITAAQNALLVQSVGIPFEKRVVSVTAAFPGAEQQKAEHRYEVINLLALA